MDALEVITVDTSLEDELEFLRFVRRDRDVRMISTRATLDGPAYRSANDLVAAKKEGAQGDFEVLLWNASIANPLCWSLYLSHYDANWMPIDPRYGEPMQYPRTEESRLAAHSPFRQQPITSQLFRYGHFDRLLSPVIELSIPLDRRQGFFSLTASFSNFVGGIWLVWNAFEDGWEHENRDLECLLQQEFQQPPEFIEWQESIFSWVREN